MYLRDCKIIRVDIYSEVIYKTRVGINSSSKTLNDYQFYVVENLIY